MSDADSSTSDDESDMDQEPDNNEDDEDEDQSSSDSEDSFSSDEEAEETDKGRVRQRWARRGTKSRYTETEQKKNINVSSFTKSYSTLANRFVPQRLGRELVRESLHARKNFEAFTRAGVSDERLELFRANPEEEEPKLRNTRLDKHGTNA